MKKLSPYDAAFERLYFINKLNTAGCDNKPVHYPTLQLAQDSLSSPILFKILKKLSAEQIKFLNERIENIQ